MISQTISSAKLPSIIDLGATAPAEAGVGGKVAGFSALLAALGDQATGRDKAPAGTGEAGTADGETPENETASGNATPSIAATGKILPLALPGLAVGPDGEPIAVGETSGEDAAETDGDEAGPALDGEEDAVVSEAGIAAAAAALPPVPTAAVASEAGDAASEPGRTAARAFLADASIPSTNDRASAPVEKPAARGEPTPAVVALQVAALPARAGRSAASREAAAATGTRAVEGEATAATSGKGAEGAPGAHGLAPSADRRTQRDPSGEQRAAPELAAKQVARTSAEATTQFTPVQAAPAAPAVVHAPTGAERTGDGVQPFAAERPALETQVARELSRIVDSLSAAREALTAKTATLAFDHAEFGELSLRFDQRRDGQLAVQIAATDPDAHRAVAAAVAERPGLGHADAGNTNGQQQAQTGTGSSARGAAADRDGNAAGNGGSRNERNEQQRGQGRADDTGKSGTGRSGIFA